MRRNIATILLLAGILLFAVSWFARTVTSRPRSQEIIVVFRYDDYSSRSDTALETKLVATFQEYALPCTFGVIPFVHTGDSHNPDAQATQPLTEEKAAILTEAARNGLIEVALHGYSHQTNRPGDNGGLSEFQGLPHQEQLRRIREGKAFLQKLTRARITSFIPPWNRYDANTLRSLRELGFDCLSASLSGGPSESGFVEFLPYTCSPWTLRRAVDSARLTPDQRPLVVVLFHPYDFVEVDKERGRITYENFRDLLQWTKAQKDVQTLTIADATKTGADLGSDRLQRNAASRSRPPYFLPFPDHFSSTTYRSASSARMLQIRMWKATLSFFTGALAISVALGFNLSRVILKRLPHLASASACVSATLACCAWAYALRDLELYFSGALVSVVLLGASSGMWCAMLKRKKAAMDVLRRE